MFWNVENLFDTIDDEGRRDEEFTPDGKLNWTEEKLDKKMKNLATVIRSVKTEDGRACPDFLGLGEVEHGRIAQMLNRGHLTECGYDKIVADPNDPDPRGIRVVSLTRLPLASSPISHKSYPGGRFIQEVSVDVQGTVTTLFLNHWKSKLPTPGGGNGSDKRFKSAEVLKGRVQKILEDNPEREILVMGDFNDEPEEASLIKGLRSTLNWAKFSEDLENFFVFWNPSAELVKGIEAFEYGIEGEDDIRAYRKLRGTYYYAAKKDFLAIDNFHLSKSLFDDEGLSYKKDSYKIVRHSQFIDELQRPIPCREGAIAKGASDHFPIMLRLESADAAFDRGFHADF